MATIRQLVQWTQPKQAGTGAQTYLVTLDQPLQAGNKVVAVTGGGTIFTLHLQSAGGTAFAKRIESANAQSLSLHDAVAAGGETIIAVTVTGPEDTSMFVIESPDLGAYIGSARASSTSLSLSQAADWQAATAAMTTTQPAMLIGAWLVEATLASHPYSQWTRWRQMGPLGRIRAQIAQQPGTAGQHIMAMGLADVTPTGKYPANLAAGQYQATSTGNFSASKFYAVGALYADNSGVATNTPYANPIAAENSLPGCYSANWFPGRTVLNANIAGYTDEVSYAPGGTVQFKVDSLGGAHRVEVYRLGHYADENFAARNVIGNQAYITGTPVAQPAPVVDGTYGSTSCGWTTTATWAIPADATPGVYCVLYRSTVTPANFAAGHFVVRSPNADGKIAITIPDMTYKAYDAWGATSDHGIDWTAGNISGRSLYRYGPDGTVANAGHRAYAASWDRPMATGGPQNNTYLYDNEMASIVMSEAQGFDLAYFSDVDLDVNPQALVHAKIVMILGHSEYWSGNVYDAYTAAANAGVNFMVSSSNIALWHVRFDPADTGRRTMICYKDSLTLDGTPGWTGTGRDPSSWTGTWRDTRAANPDRRLENKLTGQMFAVNAPSAKPHTVPFASKGFPPWRNSASIQALTAGQSYTTSWNTYGDEGDLPGLAVGAATEPDTLIMLNPTAYSWPTQGSDANGSEYTSAVSGNVSFTIYDRRSGALIFNTGAWRGWWGISRWAQSSLGGSVTAVSLDWQNAWMAAMYDLGARPTTLQALQPGLDSALTDPATGAPTGGRSGVARAYGLRSPENGNTNAIFA